jgi:glycosyltransferase involved in cell wall biosynthesis
MIINNSFAPFIRYGRPYNYAYVLNQENHVTILSVSSVSDSREFHLDCGKVVTIKARKLLVSLPGIDNPIPILIRALKVNADIYYVFAPYPLFVAFLLKLLGKTVIYDIGDDHPSLFVNTFLKIHPRLKFSKKILEESIRIVEGGLCKFFDHTITLTDTLRKERDRFTNRITTLYYCPHPSYNTANRELSILRKFKNSRVLVYEGEISEDKGLRVMLEAFSIVAREVKNVSLLLIGDFLNKYTCESDRQFFKQYILEYNLKNMVHVTGWVPYQDVPKFLNVGEVGLMLLKPWCHSFKISMPDKVLDMMACGLPIVASKGMIEVEKLLMKSKAGILVDPDDPHQVAEKILLLLKNDKLREKMRINAIDYVKQNHNWNILRKTLSCVLNQVCKSASRAK